MASATRPTFSDVELARLFELIDGSDTVELKMTVPESDLRSTVAALGMDPLQAQIRQVFFFDTPDLDLDREGLIVRARRIQNKGDDTVVKLRPVVPAELPEDLRKSRDFGVEVDAMPGGFVCSGRLKVAASDVRGVVVGERPLRKLFSKEQRRLFAAHAPNGIGLEDLAILGPVLVLKLRFAPKQLGRRMVAELWLYPDGSKVLELSARCAPDEAFQVAAETRAFLAARGVDLTGEQQAKTRKALDYFAEALSTSRA
jgi:hypothetical protein